VVAPERAILIGFGGWAANPVWIYEPSYDLIKWYMRFCCWGDVAC